MNRNLTKSTLAAALALAVFAMSPSPTYAAARPFPWWGATPVLRGLHWHSPFSGGVTLRKASAIAVTSTGGLLDGLQRPARLCPLSGGATGPRTSARSGGLFM